jgi:hypothetical protein
MTSTMTSTMSSTTIGKHALRRGAVISLLGFTGGGGAAPAHAAPRGERRIPRQRRRQVRVVSARHRA